MAGSNRNHLKRNETEGRVVSPPPLKRKIQSTTTKTTVASFFTPVSQKEPEKTTWRTVDSSLLAARFRPSSMPSTDECTQKRRRIAGFDLDSTLISSASGNKFSKDGFDWKWWNASVPSVLKAAHAAGFQIIVFSNQGSIDLRDDPKVLKMDRKRTEDFKSKVNAILNQLDLPISVYAATQRDQYRKPRVGMWNLMLDDYDMDTQEGVNLAESIFVGDAAGRTGNEKNLAKDFASSDLDFAANVGIPFKTPEEYFLAEPSKIFVRSFDPKALLVQSTSTEPSPSFRRLDPVELVVFCGSPGAGKSTFYWTYLAELGYERVNQDSLKSRDKCLKVAAAHLTQKKSVAVDNTNADPETRAHWIQLGQRFDVPVRCILFNADPKLCEHNDTVRGLNGALMNPEGRALLPKVAFTGFSSRFRLPTLAEGFRDIVPIEFKFKGTDEQQAIWSRFWI